MITLILSVLLFIAEKSGLFNKMGYEARQTIIGVLFGLSAIYATELGGVDIGGAIMNVRDAAPLCAGLLFGGPAGIIAGFIGGIERWFAVYWGVGAYTRTACTLGCITAGFLSAFFRKFMLEDKKPSWIHGVAIGIVTEVIHMLMVFFTNMDDLSKAFGVVKTCSAPMITANAIAVGAICLVIGLMDGRKRTKGVPELSKSFQKWLLLAVMVAFVATSVFTAIVQTRIAIKETADLLKLNLYAATNEVAERNKSGIDTADTIVDVTRNRLIGNTGGFVICDTNFNVLSGERQGEAIPNKEEYLKTGDYNCFKTELFGEAVYCVYTQSRAGYYIIVYLPEKEAMFTKDVSVYVTIFMEILIFALLFVLVFLLLRRLVVDNINKINATLGEITSGNLNAVVDVRSQKEFESLSDDINSTVDTLKHYLAEAEARIDKELEVARQIQHSALPNVFPPYPSRTEFDIYAQMDTAKEVGGDFYDFYFLGQNNLLFLIADVSGKGIPAAMFMMSAKTIIKGLAETGLEPEDIMTKANEKLCETNEAGMFVTVWLGILNVETGIVRYVNAGHNPPVLLRKNSQSEYFKSKKGMVLAGMEGVKYRQMELKLEKGDILLLYTDGATEAQDKEKKFYGEDRLLKCVYENRNKNMKELCKGVKSDIDEFVGDAEQFDDITMLALEVSEENPKITVDAVIANIDEVTDFVNDVLDKNGCTMKNRIKIDVAIDEIFSNIAYYAYGDETGKAEIEVAIDGDNAKIIFYDSGVEYNPLVKVDPDITLSADERQIGGLGIFMVKKSMDDMLYEYRNGQNVVTIIKNIKEK